MSEENKVEAANAKRTTVNKSDTVKEYTRGNVKIKERKSGNCTVRTFYKKEG